MFVLCFLAFMGACLFVRLCEYMCALKELFSGGWESDSGRMVSYGIGPTRGEQRCKPLWPSLGITATVSEKKVPLEFYLPEKGILIPKHPIHSHTLKNRSPLKKKLIPN